jgi:hypothetical protein
MHADGRDPVRGLDSGAHRFRQRADTVPGRNCPFDVESRPQTISDLVASAQGQQQETLGALFDAQGELHGTHWLTIGNGYSPRPLTAVKKDGYVPSFPCTMRH